LCFLAPEIQVAKALLYHCISKILYGFRGRERERRRVDCTKRVKWVRADRQWRTWRRPRKHVHQSFKRPRAEDYIGTWYWSIRGSRALSRTTQLVRVSCTAPTSPFENWKATKLVEAKRHRSSLIRAMIFLVETCAK